MNQFFSPGLVLLWLTLAFAVVLMLLIDLPLDELPSVDQVGPQDVTDLQDELLLIDLGAQVPDHY